jgi:hypothetical protein
VLLLPLVSLLLTAPALPEVCAAPAVRDVKPLTTFSQRSGSLSVGLDSVATWCFDSSGDWSAGSKKKKPADEPIGDCMVAITGCEKARAAITDDLRQLVYDSLDDLARPYLGARYVPRRSGIAERPSESADCRSQNRAELFASAQARMDLARLASQAQSEYANYRTWLYAEGLKCADAVARGVKDPTRKGITIDSPVAVDGGSLQVPKSTLAVTVDQPVKALPSAAVPAPDAGPATVVATPASTAPTEPLTRESAMSAPMMDKWRYFSSQQATLEGDVDWQTGFIASRELRACSCTRLVPGDVVRRIEAKDRLPQLETDDAKNTTCQLCLLDAFPAWKSREKKQCALMDQLSDFELGVLERSDDGNGLPPRCFDLARAKRQASDAGAKVAAPSTTSTNGGFVVTRNAPAPTVVAPVTAPKELPPLKPSDYAPIPEREDGRLYVRVFMSSSCEAEIEPGPMKARTGDLLPVPLSAKMLSVKSPCGGMAEVYWGREEKPRVSETFGKNQPLQLQFAR